MSQQLLIAPAANGTGLPGTAPGTPAEPQPTQQPQSRPPTIPGVTIVTAGGNTAPIILVIAAEKAGKSATCITSLVGYPGAGMDPLVLAWDKTGPDACIKLGYQPHAIKIAEQPGAKNWDRAKHVMSTLENNLAAIRARYGAIVIDCVSTMVDRLHEDVRRTSTNPDPRSHYGEALLESKEWINRIVDLGLPTVWLSWLKEPFIEESKSPQGQKVKKMKMGGPAIIGGTRDLIAGKAHHIIYLEKQKFSPGTQGADEEGYVRVFHTRPYENINCHGRYSHVLPEPAPAHMGFVLGCITLRGPWAPQAQAPQQGALR